MSEPNVVKSTFISKCHECGNRVKVSYEVEDWIQEPSAADYAESYVVYCEPCINAQKRDPNFEYLEPEERFSNVYGFKVERV